MYEKAAFLFARTGIREIGSVACVFSCIKDIHLANMAWWLKSAGALNFALSQEQCPISL